MELLKTIQLRKNTEDIFDTNDFDLFKACRPYTNNRIKFQNKWIANNPHKDEDFDIFEIINPNYKGTGMEEFITTNLADLGIIKIGNPYQEDSTLETPNNFIKWFPKENKIEIYSK